MDCRQEESMVRPAGDSGRPGENAGVACRGGAQPLEEEGLTV